MGRTTPARTTTWWGPSSADGGPHPLFEMRLFGLARRRVDVGLTAAVLLALVASRVLLFPGSIWEQDEAYFTLGVLDFDPTANHPHPPWFPLWIVLGKASYALVGEPTLALQLVSAAFSAWLVFPLTAAWATVLRRELAVVSALLFSFLPGSWMLAGRAFTSTAATATLALAFAAWFAAPERRAPLVGSLAAGACLVLRPHFVVAVLPVAMVALWRCRDGRERMRVVGPAVAVAAAGYAWVVAAAGGLGPLREALGVHARLHFGQLAQSPAGFANSCMARALTSSWLAAAWVVLAAAGAALLLSQRSRRAAAAPLLVGVLLPLGLLVFALSNPAHVRYAVPLLAFSSGLVVVVLAHVWRRWSVVAVAVVVAACWWRVVPVASQYRQATSPPVAAVRHAFAVARAQGQVVVVDRTLASFVELEQTVRPFSGTVLFAYQVEGGVTASPPEWATVFVFDRGNGSILERATRSREFSCREPLLRRQSQDRFLEVTVAEGAELRPASSRTR